MVSSLLTNNLAHLLHSIPPYLIMSQHERCSLSRSWKAVSYRAIRYEWRLKSFFQYKYNAHQHCIFSFVVVAVLHGFVLHLHCKSYAFKQTTNGLYFKNSRHLFNQSYGQQNSIATCNWSSSFSCTWLWLSAYTSRSHWFIAFFLCVVMYPSLCFSFSFGFR